MNRKPRVLIVDDEKAYCEAMRDVLEDAGVHVYLANNAPAAETLFRILVPDLVLLDVMMPGMSGLDLIPKLRAFVGWESLPIVVASALGTRATREAALSAGANAFLAKPFASKELRDVVRRYLPLAQTGALPPAA
jgi:CheY-like chemotaxis protein